MQELLDKLQSMKGQDDAPQFNYKSQGRGGRASTVPFDSMQASTKPENSSLEELARQELERRKKANAPQELPLDDSTDPGGL